MQLADEITSYADSDRGDGALYISTDRLREWADKVQALEEAEAARKLHAFLTEAM